MSEFVYTVEIVAYDPGAAGTVTLRYATQGFATASGDTPASTFYDGRVVQVADMQRSAFSNGTTQGPSSIAVGDVVLANDDGGLDGLLAYGFDGRAITIRQGLRGAAYPGSWTTTLVATMEQCEFSHQRVTIKLRDRQFSLTTPFQTTKYAGSNALPAGVEGVAGDLLGKPKPVTLGQVFNVSAPCVNTSKLIYQVSDGAVASVDAVYDKGVALGASGFIAASYNSGKMASSVPGTSGWSVPANTGITANALACGIVSGRVVVAGITFSNVYYSEDGFQTYTNAAALGGAGICYSAALGLWIICNGAQLQSSSDLVTWTVRQATGGPMNEVKLLGSLFVAAGDGGLIYTSTNGTAWTGRGAGVQNYRSVCGTTNLYVVAGDNGECYSSTDGITWTSRTSGFGATAVKNAAYGNGTFVLVGMSGKLATSPDMTNWTIRNIQSDSGTALYGVDFGGSAFVAVGYDTAGSVIFASGADGLTWLRVFGANNASDLYASVTYYSGMLPPAYSAYADLTDNTKAPAAGFAKAFLGGGGNGAYIRLGSPPAGTITADVTQGAAAADRTAAQIWKAVLVRAGLSGADYSAADITALDTATASAVLGLYVDSETDYASVCDLIANSVGAWWGPDATGVFRIQQWVAPSGSAVVSYTANDLLAPLQRRTTTDPGRGLPSYQTVLNFARNYTVQTADQLAGSVSDARRGVLALDWATVKSTDATVQTTYLLAEQTTENSYLVSAAAAATEVARRQTLRGTRRDVWTLVVPVDGVYTCPDVGNVIQLTHARYGFSAGKLLRVMGVAPDAANRRATLTCWL